MTSTLDTPTDLVPPEKLPYMRGIDGLRAIAVMAVLFYHADFTWARGGFLGVEVFFVISGYLITSLLLVEWLRTGTIGLKQFWIRRARRLLPAVFLLLAVVSVLSILFYRDTVHRMLADVLAASGYVTNWYLIVEDVSYFETFGRPPLLQHLWSLSLEEQFYVLWPLIFTFGMALFSFKRRQTTIRAFLGLTIVGIIASTALMAMKYVPYEDPSRVYYGTDTRAAGILVGVALSLVWIPWRLNASLAFKKVRLLNVTGLGALAALLWILVAMDEFAPLLYRGGFLITSVVTAIVIAVTVHPAARLGPILEARPLKWVGTRSYGIYLWHWPIFMLMRPGFDVIDNTYVVFAVRTALTFAIAEVSFRYVEAPIRHFGLRAWIVDIRRFLGISSVRGASVFAVSVLVAFAFLAGGLVLGATRSPAVSIASQAVEDGEPIPDLVSGQGDVTTTSALPASEESASDSDPTEEPAAEPAPDSEPIEGQQDDSNPSSGEETSTTDAAAGPSTTIVAAALRVSIIGDSVVAGAQAPIEAVFGESAVIDATVNRQFKHANDVAAQMASDGLLGDVVVVHLGTNGTFSADTFDEVMLSLDAVDKVIVVNAKVPRRWEQSVNRTIAEGQSRWPDVVVIDWHSIAGDHPEWFNDDQVHLNRTGQRAYADLLHSVVND
ncbi:MAG: acyltransferase family protein [Acidimicrobiia bacterium]